MWWRNADTEERAAGYVLCATYILLASAVIAKALGLLA